MHLVGNIDPLTKLLLHFDGDFCDYGSTGHAVTPHGDVHVDTGQKVFGTGSADFDGDGDYLSIPDSEDWYFGTGNFTIDFWVKFRDVSSNVALYTQVSDWVWSYYVRLYLYHDGSSSFLRFLAGAGDINTNLTCLWDDPPPKVDTWYHVAMVKNGTKLTLYVGGRAIGEYDGHTQVVPDISAPLFIGAAKAEGDPQDFDGWMDEIRISKGIARWTSDFTPEGPYPIPRLRCYSEDTVKTQGSYSLKVVAEQFGSLNHTLTSPDFSHPAPAESLGGCS